MSANRIHLTDSTRILRFASTLLEVSQAHPFKDGAIVDLYARALDTFEEALTRCEREIAELCQQLKQTEDDDACAKLQRQISELEQKKAQIQADRQTAEQAKRSYEEQAAELDSSFTADAERVATTLERFVKSLERASNA